MKVGKTMIRPLLSLKRLSFDETGGKSSYGELIEGIQSYPGCRLLTCP